MIQYQFIIHHVSMMMPTHENEKGKHTYIRTINIQSPNSHTNIINQQNHYA